MDERAYRDHVIAHYQNPQQAGRLAVSSCSHRVDNPLCGDTTEVDVLLQDDRVIDMAHETTGCAISVASASLIASAAIGTDVSEVLAWNQDDVLKLLRVKVTPVRIKCAALVLVAMQDALRIHAGENPVGLNASVRGAMDVTAEAMKTLRNQI